MISVPKLGDLVPELSPSSVSRAISDRELRGLFAQRKNQLGGRVSGTLRKLSHETSSGDPTARVQSCRSPSGQGIDEAEVKQRLIAVPPGWHELKIPFVIPRSGDVVARNANSRLAE